MSRLVQQSSGSHSRATPYPSPVTVTNQTVLAAVKTLTKKQDDLFEKVSVLERKLLVFMHESFDISKMPYYANFVEEMARTYCASIRREASLAQMQAVATKCLGNDARSRNIFSVAMTKFKDRMNYFRAEERRKLLGNSPYECYKSKNTLDVCESLMKSMKAPASIKDIFVRHVAIARKYIRSLNPDSKNSFTWVNYRKWLQLYYPNEETIDWVDVIAEDEGIIYGNDYNEVLLQEEETETPFVVEDDLELD